MERTIKNLLISVITTLLFAGSAYAQNFVSGSTGVDGEFNPTTTTEIQLPPNGIFNFTTVNIPAGVTVTFKKNAANTPAYILATGDVNISGTISVSGSNAVANDLGRGGAGGFDGGYGGEQNKPGGRGMGPGGGGSTNAYGGYGGGGAFGTAEPGPCGAYYCIGGSVYGNERILPFIGGSGAGGGGQVSNIGGGGGGGGGAILIASSGTINITGSIIANGGAGAIIVNSSSYPGTGGGGSGGAIKLIANTIAGNGTVSAVGAVGVSSAGHGSNSGGNGRIRLEAFQITRTTGTSSPAFTRGFPTSVFIANTPSIKITAIGGANVPQNPTGLLATPDITLPAATTNPVTVGLSASYVPLNTSITVVVSPQSGMHSNIASTPLSGTLESSTATASITLSTDYPSVIMATATFTIQTAMFFDGEKIEKVRVASTMGKGSEVTYITETGKEIPAEKLMASLVK